MTGDELRDERHRENAFSRAWADLKSITRSWRFGVSAALITAVFAGVGAVAVGASAAERIGWAVAGTFGGSLLLGLVVCAFVLARAPVRQRDEARTELNRLSASSVRPNPAAFVEEYSTWLQATRAALPAYPSYSRALFVLNREAREKQQAEQAVMQERYRATYDEVVRQARVAYHERFRAGALDLVGEGHEKARNPQTLDDLGAIETLLLASQPVSVEGVAAFQDFAQRFAGWLKGQAIAAPPDMAAALGADFEDEQANKLASGELSTQEYLRATKAFAERREWAQHLLAAYQQDWRAEVTRRLEWARRTGVMEREDYLALVLIENPHLDELKELAASAERMAERF